MNICGRYACMSVILHLDNNRTHFVSEKFLTHIQYTYCEKKNSSDREKLLKFEAVDQEFGKLLRSLEQIIHTVKGQNNF